MKIFGTLIAGLTVLGLGVYCGYLNFQMTKSNPPETFHLEHIDGENGTAFIRFNSRTGEIDLITMSGADNPQQWKVVMPPESYTKFLPSRAIVTENSKPH